MKHFLLIHANKQASKQASQEGEWAIQTGVWSGWWTEWRMPREPVNHWSQACLWRRADHKSVEQVGKSILSVDRAPSIQPKPQTQQNMKVRSPFSVLMSCLRHQRTPSTLNARTYATEGCNLFPWSGSFLLRLNFIARLLGSSTCGQPAVRLLGAHRKPPWLYLCL